MSRVETGPVRIGDDWPGIFIRGDNALGFALTLTAVMLLLSDDRYWWEKRQLKRIAALLLSCNEYDNNSIVELFRKEDAL